MSQVISFEKINRINQRTKDIVFGFIRHINKSVSADNTPPLIKYLCVLFYYASIESNILTSKEIQNFEELFYNYHKTKHLLQITHEWKLLFRGSMHGFTDVKFNKIVPNNQNIVVIIHSSDNNVFGGYSKTGYDSIFKHSTDSNAFLYLLRSSKGYKPQIFDIKSRDVKSAVYTASSYICCFGKNGYNIALTNNCDKNSSSWVDWEGCWEQGSYDTPSKYYLNGGKEKFRVIDIEIFSHTKH
eukprot:301161_1